jgi:SAM-dependent methyltransferase
MSMELSLAPVTKGLRRLRAKLFGTHRPRAVPDHLVRERLVAEPWFIDTLTAAGRCVSVTGWSLPPQTPNTTVFAVNGSPFEVTQYPLPRPDVGKVLWQRKRSELSGFQCSSCNVATLYPNGVLEVSRSGDTPALETGRDSWFIPDPTLHTDLPDEDRRFRVIGNRDASGFLTSGATDFHRLDSAIRAVSGRSLWEFERILDWGVGCGRVARHFPKECASRFTGCDIDHDNVAWCSDHLPGTFVASSLQPPLPFPASAFDLVYGISVFTHLKEPLQFQWLEELHRITVPGGFVLTTVHGDTTVDFSRLLPSEYLRLRAEIKNKGLLVASANPQLDGAVDHRGEYVNVFHTKDYILRRWGEYFNVLHIISGYIFTHDLVVMQRET